MAKTIRDCQLLPTLRLILDKCNSGTPALIMGLASGCDFDQVGRVRYCALHACSILGG